MYVVRTTVSVGWLSRAVERMGEDIIRVYDAQLNTIIVTN